jgi:geranylgeranyl pyrophosphate synthase
VQNSSPKLRFQESLLKARLTVEPKLALAEKIMLEIAQGAPGELAERIEKLVSRKGKRVRATMVFLLHGINELDDERAARVAASIELLHLASLVHDDIIDASEMRRGELTAHAEWGNKIAVLVGDYLLSKSMELVVGDEARRIPILLSRVSSRLAEGEVLELDWSGKDNLSYEQYIHVIDGKTGSLLEACGECGAILAGLNQEQINAAARMGRAFGLAFQIVDDLLDFGVGAQELGKATYADLNNGLVTLPLLYHYQTCSEEEKQSMKELISQSQEKEIQEQIYARLEASGAFAQTQEKAQELLKEAQEMLDILPDAPNVQLLSELCSTMAYRAR